MDYSYVLMYLHYFFIMSELITTTNHGDLEVQQATQEAEDTLLQGLDALNQSLSDTIASNSLSAPANMTNYKCQMDEAMNELTTLENCIISL
ncbi:hypothetical protein HanHA300_Chr06g0225561 [Helianthus annuus]|nr:hypothetical protein HanHA300_Chr06g0225561 [Helianthus annuus]KAJ0568398.1 hypothetical protein HanIR_Chr06g0295791 [Helianthus annuus]KAJ0574727.1 hypothetical protein HanHA89_Chr06g0241511 [Helianthus annuus]KAJ0739058.1 hypothetical protein HanLR1_Chr06g0225421 [Helianthus annuus]